MSGCVVVREFRPASSNIAHVSFDDALGEMRVTFTNGGSYAYRGVPAATYEAFEAAPSAGQFFHRHIKSQHVGALIG